MSAERIDTEQRLEAAREMVVQLRAQSETARHPNWFQAGAIIGLWDALEQERSDTRALRSEVEGLQAKRAYLEKFVVEQQERIRLLEQACARFLAAFSDCVALRRWDEGYEEWADVEELKTALSRAKALLPKSPAPASDNNNDFAG